MEFFLGENRFTINSSCVKSCFDYDQWLSGQTCTSDRQPSIRNWLCRGPTLVRLLRSFTCILACEPQGYLSLEQERFLLHLARDCTLQDGLGLSQLDSCPVLWFHKIKPFPLLREEILSVWPGDNFSRGPWTVGPNYIHNNTKMLISFFTVILSRVYGGIF